jgi:hypothetical protein
MTSMRLTALPLIALGLFMLGESLNGSIVLRCITEIGAFSFLAWFCWYGVTRVIPRMQEVFRKETMLERTHHREIIDKLVERQEKDRVATREVLQELIAHCARQRDGEPKQD